MIFSVEAWVPALCVDLLAAPLKPQEPPLTRLTQTRPDIAAGFHKADGIKALRDGRVILVDGIERLILLVIPSLQRERPSAGRARVRGSKSTVLAFLTCWRQLGSS